MGCIVVAYSYYLLSQSTICGKSAVFQTIVTSFLRSFLTRSILQYNNYMYTEKLASCCSVLGLSDDGFNILFARKVKHKTKKMSLLQDCRAVENR